LGFDRAARHRVWIVRRGIGFPTDIALHGKADLAGHSIIAALMCIVLVMIGVRVNQRSREARRDAQLQVHAT
jgi:hypothetical protein